MIHFWLVIFYFISILSGLYYDINIFNKQHNIFPPRIMQREFLIDEELLND